jgi:predicted ribosome quality control (RQC) complex YloA/Tae2 family protein
MLNAFNIERLALELKDGANSILNKRLVNAFTTGKFELFLCFEHLVIKVIFFDGQAYFQFPVSDKLQKKNRQPIFMNLVGQKVSSVIIHPFDRIFRIKFTNENELGFLLFGRFSQIIQFQGRDIAGKFPVKTKDFAFNRLELKSSRSILESRTSEDASFKDLRFLDNHQRETFADLLAEDNSLENQIQALESIRAKALQNDLHINKSEVHYSLSYYQNESTISLFSSIMQAFDQFASLYIAHQTFKRTKASLISAAEKEVKMLEQKLASLKVREKSIAKAESYKEMADLLMANLYTIEQGSKNVELLSFDGEQKLVIRLKSDLSPQANAERYYKKAKNEGKQLEFLLQNRAETEKALQRKKSELEALIQLNDFKSLKKKAEQNTNKTEMRLPYKQVEVLGYEVRIGKGAKDNDELIRQFAAKNDIWLHAKDTSGSHVIIRNPSKKAVPMSVIERVAEIAAFHSKSKTDTLAAVIYTERKFVRKPKKANPGAVRVEKEKVILVEPNKA